MFHNYVRTPSLSSPVNYVAVRLVFGFYLLWKIASIDIDAMSAYPTLLDTHLFLFPGPTLEYLWVEQLAGVIGCLLFILGYHLRITAFVTAVLTAHLGTAVWMFNWSGTTQAFFMASLFLVLYAIYADYDPLPFEDLRQMGGQSLSEITDSLRSQPSGPFQYPVLRAFALLMGIIYFGSGLEKLLRGGPSWASATNLGRRFQSTQAGRGYDPVVGELVLEFPSLLAIGAAATLIFELGLLVSLLLGRGFSLIVVGLIGFHTMATLAMGPIFLDHTIFLLLFLKWGAVLSTITRAD